MTQEQKQILLEDLCARLPYGVKLRYVEDLVIKEESHIITLNNIYLEHILNGDADIKPYLRPISSMTEEEREELFQIWKLGKENGSESVTKLLKEIFYKAINENYILKLATSFENWIDVMAWFNKKHFDYRGLIEKELAVKATEEMYK